MILTNKIPTKAYVFRHNLVSGGHSRTLLEISTYGKVAPRAGFEPATIRLTVECSTAELPRNRRNQFARLRITKPLSLAKDEIFSSSAISRGEGSGL
jgi:hypothetical protein